MKDETRKTLEICIEKANKLREMKLDEHIAQTIIGIGFQAHRTINDDWEVEFDLPDNEKSDATLFTFRLFLQENEKYSFKKIKHLIKDVGLSEEFRSKMSEAYKRYVDLLNHRPVDIHPDFFEVGEYPTCGDILEVVMYGDMAHTNNPEKRRKYQYWTRDDIRKYVLLQHFWFIVSEVLKLIYRISDLCKEEHYRQSSSIIKS
jgi:hypothetical protein